MITPDDIEIAAARIAPHVRRTPVIELATGEFGFDFSVCLKLEFMQHAGSFKARGAFNRMLSAALPPQGVIAASGGNHGLAVAYAARQLGVPAEIFVPEISAPVKIRRLRELSATVHVTGRSYAEAWQACEARQRETGALVVHAYDQPEVVAGGGGLIGGVAAWHAGHKRVVGVEPATSRALHAALSAGEPVDVEVSGIAADSLGARRVGSVMFPIARRYVERVVLVDDEAIAQARHVLWRELRIVAEPGGAAAFASLLCGAWRPAPGQRVGVLVCGANCDPAGVDVPA